MVPAQSARRSPVSASASAVVPPSRLRLSGSRALQQEPREEGIARERFAEILWARARGPRSRSRNDIAQKSERMSAESHSEAMDAIFDKAHQELQNLELQFQPEVNQVGAAFALDGRIVGLEVFDAAETWRRFSPKVTAATGWIVGRRNARTGRLY